MTGSARARAESELRRRMELYGWSTQLLDVFAAELDARTAALEDAREALRALVADQSVEAFIGYPPTAETHREIEAKFDHGRTVLRRLDDE